MTAADIADDFDLFDGATTVTVARVNPDTGVGEEAINDVPALKRATDRREDDVGEGGVPVQSATWHLKASELSFVPKKRDLIIEGGSTIWVVEAVSKATFSTRYACQTTLYPG